MSETNLPEPTLLELTESAQRHFARLMASQGGDADGIALSAVHPGTPKADARLAFCEAGELTGDEWMLQCEGFALYVDAASAPYFEGARIDFIEAAGGGQLNIRAPKLKGSPPDANADLAEQVRYLLDTEINPQLASWRPRVAGDDHRRQRRGVALRRRLPRLRHGRCHVEERHREDLAVEIAAAHRDPRCDRSQQGRGAVYEAQCLKSPILPGLRFG